MTNKINTDVFTLFPNSGYKICKNRSRAPRLSLITHITKYISIRRPGKPNKCNKTTILNSIIIEYFLILLDRIGNNLPLKTPCMS